MEWNDTGLVLAKGVFREADVWLRLLFREHGVRTVFAFGGLRSRRRFVGCLDLMNELECRVKASRTGSYEDLEEAVLVRGPGRLRSSRSSLGLAANCLRLVDCAGVPPEAAPDSFRLAREMLALLESGTDRPGVLGLFFRLRFMGLLGYAPDLGHCMGCRSSRGAEAFFCVEEGGVLCPDCRRRRAGMTGAMLSGPALDALEEVQRGWPPDWTGLDLAARDRRGAAFCINGVLTYHAGLMWDRGRFVRTRTN
ncbi:MAG: DNA repair protein RecO [Desulfovibrionaceae bacterium]|nr:DNA repair protein RecO [Desulfovibrionaceae bacterium]